MHMPGIPGFYGLESVLSRQALALLRDLLLRMNYVSTNGRNIILEASVSIQLFDRLCMLGAATENDEEDDPTESNDDIETADY